MGTRNITRVIYKNQIIINQYCQWDGYPTGHGLNVMYFVKKYCCNEEQLKEFKKRLDKSCLLLAVGGKYTAVGAPVTRTFTKLSDMVYEKDFTSWEKLIADGTVKKHQVKEYLSATRDTGSDILLWLMANEPDGMIFFTTNYDYNMGLELDWQIEGMYVIDLDTETVKIDYHGKIMEYPFEMVRNMSEEQMDTDMKNFEKEDNEEEDA